VGSKLLGSLGMDASEAAVLTRDNGRHARAAPKKEGHKTSLLALMALPPIHLTIGVATSSL
jgi:hypothetical protein